jgi:hypothetical protein
MGIAGREQFYSTTRRKALANLSSRFPPGARSKQKSTVRTLYAAPSRMARLECMDKKQINDPKMTWNFLIWVGGVFMLSLFAFLAHFVWKIF